MALQDMYTQQGSFEDFYGSTQGLDGGMGSLDLGFGDFASSLGQDYSSMRNWTGGASANNQELGGDGGWQYNMPGLQQMFQGYTFGARPTEGGGQILDAMQGGNVVSSHRAGSDDNWFDAIGPYLPLLVGGAGLAAGAMGGAAAGGAGAGGASGGAMSMGDAIAAMGSAEGAAGAGALGAEAAGVGGAAASGVELGGATNIVGGSMPMATPAPWAATPGVGAGMTPAMGASAGAPMGAELSASLGGAGALGGGGAALSSMGMEQPQMMSAGNYSDAAAGYGEGMSGADTSMFDGLLGLTGSPEVANFGTQMASPVMNNPVMDELRKLREMMGKPVAGKLTGGDLVKGGLNFMQNRANSKQLKGQQASLEGLYGQNSPYAQSMRQQLERRDAASGRRSQYGPREVELQAALAGNAAKLAPTLNQLGTQRIQNRNQGHAALGQMLNKSGFLQNLFGG
jgi:hypothetical protein